MSTSESQSFKTFLSSLVTSGIGVFISNIAIETSEDFVISGVRRILLLPPQQNCMVYYSLNILDDTVGDVMVTLTNMVAMGNMTTALATSGYTGVTVVDPPVFYPKSLVQPSTLVKSTDTATNQTTVFTLPIISGIAVGGLFLISTVLFLLYRRRQSNNDVKKSTSVKTEVEKVVEDGGSRKENDITNASSNKRVK